LKLGAPTPAAEVSEPPKAVKREEKRAEAPISEEKAAPVPERAFAPTNYEPYAGWSNVLERISELNVSLSAQFLRAEALRSGNSFLIKMSDFFAKTFSSNPRDMDFVRGVIAEVEKISKAEISLSVGRLGSVSSSPRSDLDKLFSI
jgi:hypothetical protein